MPLSKLPIHDSRIESTKFTSPSPSSSSCARRGRRLRATSHLKLVESLPASQPPITALKPKDIATFTDRLSAIEAKGAQIACSPEGFRVVTLGPQNNALPSQVLVLTSGVHGNEPSGIAAGLNLLENWVIDRPNFAVIWLPMINAEGFLKHRRRCRGQDLNRVMTPQQLASIDEVNKTAEAFTKARELQNQGAKVLVLDLHASVAVGKEGFFLIPSAQCKSDFISQALAQFSAAGYKLLSREIVTAAGSRYTPRCIPPSISPEKGVIESSNKGTLRDFADQMFGLAAITCESPGRETLVHQTSGHVELVTALTKCFFQNESIRSSP